MIDYNMYPSSLLLFMRSLLKWENSKKKIPNSIISIIEYSGIKLLETDFKHSKSIRWTQLLVDNERQLKGRDVRIGRKFSKDEEIL